MPNNLIGEKYSFPKWETTLLLILDHMFREKEALRHAETNNIELALEWLFSHLKEPSREEDGLSEALSLSFG